MDNKTYTLTTEKLTELLREAFSGGYDAGGHNERSSLHDYEPYDEARDACVTPLIEGLK